MRGFSRGFHWRCVLVVLVLVGALTGSRASARDGFVLALDVLDAPLDQTLSNVEKAARLGATHFNVPVLLCQKDRYANTMRWCGGEPESIKEKLGRLARELSKKGYTLGIFPFLLSDDGAWRGFFAPSDFDAWGEAYLGYLSEIARWATSMGFVEFIAGSELNGLYDHERYWRTALARLKGLMPGIAVFIVANWDRYDKIPFWDASDYIGLSAYYPLTSSEDSESSVETLTESWRGWAEKLIKVSRDRKRPLYFSEVGYASMTSAAHEPWRFAPPAPLDLDLQRRLYQAFSNIWAAPDGPDTRYGSRLARFMLWALEFVEDPSLDTGFSVIGKPAERPLSEAFERRRLTSRRRKNMGFTTHDASDHAPDRQRN